jgi:hypothetical protein
MQYYRAYGYMNFFDQKDVGNHLMKLCPKVVKHPVCIFYVLYVTRMVIVREFRIPSNNLNVIESKQCTANTEFCH